MEVILFFAVILGGIFLIYRPTGYKPKSFTGGYSEIQLGDGIWEVKFQGNGNTRPGRSADLCMLRCAELTLQKGYQFFVILGNREGNEGYIPDGRYGPQSSHPGSTNRIKMLKDNNGTGYDAAITFQSLKAKYGIK